MNIQQLISRHTTQWFHRVGWDESSPALLVSEVSSCILDYIAAKRLSLTIPERTFRNHMCEFLCTYYIANKKGVPWRGPLSRQSRPTGWTHQHEMEWKEYLTYHLFSNEFWNTFWSRFPEAVWEAKAPYWRESFPWVVLHYIHVQPDKIEFQEEDTDSLEEDSE
jgi:hypothetical protein